MSSILFLWLFNVLKLKNNINILGFTCIYTVYLSTIRHDEMICAKISKHSLMKNVLLFETTALTYPIVVFLFSTINCEKIHAKKWNQVVICGHWVSYLLSSFFCPPCIIMYYTKYSNKDARSDIHPQTSLRGKGGIKIDNFFISFYDESHRDLHNAFYRIKKYWFFMKICP